jgi:hypothetical protein
VQPAGNTDYCASLRNGGKLHVYGSAPQCKLLWTNEVIKDNWSLLSPILRQVSLSSVTMCGTNSNNELTCGDYDPNPNYRRIAGSYKWISLDSLKACAINLSNQVVCTDDITVSTPTWMVITGRSLVQIDVEGQNMCGVDSSNNVFCATYNQTNWRQLVGVSVKQVSIYGKRICGVNSLNEAYCSSDLTASTVTWVKLGRSFTSIETFYITTCGVGTDKAIYCSYAVGEESWVNRGRSDVTQIALLDQGAMITTTTGQIYFNSDFLDS